MKPTVIVAAGVALAIVAVHEAAAQSQQQPRSESSAAPVRIILPPGGLAFKFGDIYRNGDNSISVEEWNAFVASLQSRTAAKEPGSAAGGATAAPKTPQPQR